MDYFRYGMDADSKSRQVNNNKFYEDLNLSKNCTPEEIRNAYKKLSRLYHPDKGGDAEKFKDVSRAYEVLSDPKKREKYDKYGEEGLEGTYTADPFDIFDMFLGKRDKSENIYITKPVTLEQIYKGETIKVEFPRTIICTSCDGHGGPVECLSICSHCNGKGIKVSVRCLGPVIQQTQCKCPHCKGAAKIMPPDKKCRTCSGNGTIKSIKSVDLEIDKGVAKNYKTSFQGLSHQKPGEIPGDVIVTIEQQEHKIFKRDKNDLSMKKTITLLEALTSFEFIVTLLDGRNILVKSKPGEIISHGTIKVIKEEGMPIYQNPLHKGDLYITFDIMMPPSGSLSIKSCQKIADELRPIFKKQIEEEQSKKKKCIEYEECILEDFDAEELKRKRERKQAREDEDDHNYGREEQGVYCNTQ